MNPAERAAWLRAHKGPPGMHLLTEREIEGMNSALLKENAAKKRLFNILNLTSAKVGPDRMERAAKNLERAVAELVFDEDRFRFSAEQAERIVNESITNLQTIANAIPDGDWEDEMIANLANDLGKLLVVLRTQRAKKWEGAKIE